LSRRRLAVQEFLKQLSGNDRFAGYPMLIDTHCHLDFPDFAPEQAEIVARAQARGVGRMITISTHVTKFAAIAAIAERYEDVFCTVGTHPNHALDEPEASPEQLVALARHPKCVAFGEAGLDYHYNHAPKDTAARVFRNHIAAARKAGLPLVIHTRDADEDCARILRQEMGQGAFTALLHCFTASQALADTALELGLYISFSGVVTFKNSQALRDVAASLPLERMLVETDAPFLAPTPHRGKRNEPAFVAETAAVLARLKGLSDADFAAATTANALRLFSKMPPLSDEERAA
jgi:TatD DNase family protein